MTAGRPRAEGTSGWRETKSWSRRTVADASSDHFAHDHEPRCTGRILRSVAGGESGVRQDGGERVVEVMRETAHVSPSERRSWPLVEPPRSRPCGGEVTGPAPERQDGAIQLDLGARTSGARVLDLFMSANSRGFLGGAGSPPLRIHLPTISLTPATQLANQTAGRGEGPICFVGTLGSRLNVQGYASPRPSGAASHLDPSAPCTSPAGISRV